MTLNDAKSVASQLAQEEQRINKGKRDIEQATRLLKLKQEYRKANPPIHVKIGNEKESYPSLIIVVAILLVVIVAHWSFMLGQETKKPIIKEKIFLIEKPVAIPTTITNYLTQEVSLENLTEECFIIENKIDKTKGFYCR